MCWGLAKWACSTCFWKARSDWTLFRNQYVSRVFAISHNVREFGRHGCGSGGIVELSVLLQDRNIRSLVWRKVPPVPRTSATLVASLGRAQSEAARLSRGLTEYANFNAASACNCSLALPTQSLAAPIFALHGRHTRAVWCSHRRKQLVRAGCCLWLPARRRCIFRSTCH